MANVKDTESFILAAMALHGKRYDYSQSVFTKSSEKITIVCRVCGPFVMAQAESHYRKTKSCGCKTCEKKGSLRRSGRFHVCPMCRKWAVYKDTHGYCRDCRDIAAIVRNERKSRKNKSPCKVCGKLIHNSNGRVTCSPECSKIHSQRSKVEKRIEVECCACGVSVTRYKNALKNQERFCCSIDCQRHFALVENRSTAGKIDWVERSKRAKELFKRRSTRKRRMKNEWFVAISRLLSKSSNKPCDFESWEYRVRSRFSASNGRVTRRKNNYACSSSVEQALAKIIQRRKYFELSEWEKKIGFKLSSHKARRSRKNANKQTRTSFEKAHEGVCYVEKDRKQRMQMCFEWLANYSEAV